MARAQVEKTHCPHGHPYSGDNLGFWGGQRRCLTCCRGWQRLSQTKKYHAEHPEARYYQSYYRPPGDSKETPDD